MNKPRIRKMRGTDVWICHFPFDDSDYEWGGSGPTPIAAYKRWCELVGRKA